MDSNIDMFFDNMYKINLSRQDINNFRSKYRHQLQNQSNL